MVSYCSKPRNDQDPTGLVLYSTGPELLGLFRVKRNEHTDRL